MAFGDEKVGSPPGEPDWVLHEIKTQEARRCGTRSCRGAGPTDAFWEGNPFSPRSATHQGRVALCGDGGCVSAAGMVGGGVGCPAGVPPAPARGWRVLLSDSHLRGWSHASLQILTNNITGLVALK